MILVSETNHQQIAQAWCDVFGFVWQAQTSVLPHLLWDGSILYWCDTAFKKPFFVDFSSPHLQRRMKNYRHEALIRAIGDVSPTTSLCDATAGFGEDAMILSALGTSLTLIEKHPVTAALLQNGMMRLSEDAFQPSKHYQTGKKQLYVEDSAHHLQNHRYDVVYIDPMFQGALKGQVKKKAQVLNQLATDFDDEALFYAAYQAAQKKVVVKRAKQAKELDKKPSYQIAAGVVRFDIYVKA